MFFYSPFVAQKENNAQLTDKISFSALCSRVASDIHLSNLHCRKSLVFQAVGIKELAFHVIAATSLCAAQTTFVLNLLLERRLL